MLVVRSLAAASLTFLAAACLGGTAPPPAGDDDGAGDDTPGDDDGGGGDDDGSGDGGGDPAQVTCTEITGITGIAKVIECVPDDLGAAPAPLVVALHGYTQTAEEYRDTTEWHRLAARYHFVVVFPQTNADLVGAGGKPAAWKWWRDYAPWTRQSFNPHFGPLTTVVTQAKERHAIDPDRVYLTGLSAGGYMTTLMLAAYPDVFAAGASFSGGPHNCDLQCTDSDKIQDWRRPPGYVPPGADDVVAAYPTYWNDAATRKPRLILFHGARDEAVMPINLDDATSQWTGALGIDATPDNASLGAPSNLGGYDYKIYARDGEAAVATVLMSDLGHGTPVKPGAGVDEGGVDPVPSQTACDVDVDPSCTNDWTNTGAVYGAYQAARFFELAP